MGLYRNSGILEAKQFRRRVTLLAWVHLSTSFLLISLAHALKSVKLASFVLVQYQAYPELSVLRG